jgi:2'-5' RNA ligase
VFVAVPVGAEARARVQALAAGVAADPALRSHGRLRWAVTDHLHLTIRFLGATPPARVPDVVAAAHAAVAGLAPFEVRIEGAGAFPAQGRPRVVWLGIDRGAEGLAELAAALDRELVGRGWPAEERPFRAHLTLARADGVAGAGAIVDALRVAAAGLEAAWTADRLVVYRSELGHGPARYHVLDEAALGGGALPGPSSLG